MVRQAQVALVPEGHPSGLRQARDGISVVGLQHSRGDRKGPRHSQSVFSGQYLHSGRRPPLQHHCGLRPQSHAPAACRPVTSGRRSALATEDDETSELSLFKASRITRAVIQDQLLSTTKEFTTGAYLSFYHVVLAHESKRTGCLALHQVLPGSPAPQYRLLGPQQPEPDPDH